MPMGSRETKNSTPRGQEHSSLSESKKMYIDKFMNDAIDKNQFALVVILMSPIRYIRERDVIDYIEANYPKGYLLTDDRLERRIREALMEPGKTCDFDAAYEIKMKMLSRDWDGHI